VIVTLETRCRLCAQRGAHLRAIAAVGTVEVNQLALDDESLGTHHRSG